MKKFGLLTTLLVAGLLLTGCNKTIVENCGDDCINESDIDVLEHKCMEYVNKALFDNIEKTPNPTVQYFYDNSGSMEYTFTDAQFSGTYYGIKGYAKAGDKSQNFICNIYTGGGLHDLYFYNDKSNDEEPVVEEPTYEILEWTGYMGCIGGCEDGSDEEYVEGYYYRYTNPELGLRITTPSGDGGNYNEGFRIKRETPIFKLVDNTIYSLEYDYASNWSISDAEFIKVYDKDPSISLENLLKEKYQNCRIEKVESNNLKNFHGFGAYFYDIKSDRGLREDNCIAREEGEGGSLVFYIESKDDNKYYKVGVNDGCAPGPCSIFGNVEAL